MRVGDEASVLYTQPCGASPPAAWEPEAFLMGLETICSQHPHWSLLQLLTEVRGPRGREGWAYVFLPPQSQLQLHCVAPLVQTIIGYMHTWARGRTCHHPETPGPPNFQRSFPQPCLCPECSLIVACPPCWLGQSHSHQWHRHLYPFVCTVRCPAACFDSHAGRGSSEMSGLLR